MCTRTIIAMMSAWYKVVYCKCISSGTLGLQYEINNRLNQPG